MKFVIVCGGVLSGLGKGIVSASVGFLLKTRGYDVTAIKIDPYVSIDAGTMRPAEHGEVFITHDGGEIDQDLGNYERFLDVTLSKDHNITTGKVFQNVIDKERHFFYKGRDAEMIPDVVNEIKEMIYTKAKGHDIAVVEVGGTTGDLENMVFLHAMREIGKEHKAAYIMVTYLPYLRNVGELKTKPTQHAVTRLRETGIMPDFIVTRNEVPIDEPRMETIAKRCFVKLENVIDDPDIDSIYKLPLMFEENKFGEKILKTLDLKPKKTTLEREKWRQFVKKLENPKKKIKVALVGKYVVHGRDLHKDVYISVLESITHAAVFHNIGIDVEPIDSTSFEKMSDKEIEKILGEFQGIVVPQGWGSRGTEGKIRAAQFAREHKIPYLGLCFGMQMASVEFGRNVVGLTKANSEEVDPKTKYPVIHVMPHQKEYLEKKQYGGTIRLGAWPCVVKPNTKLYEAYKVYGNDKKAPWWQRNISLSQSLSLRKDNGNNDLDLDLNLDSNGLLIHERHRHRYEFNNEFRKQFEAKGFVFSGTSPDGELVEAIELKDHPFFVGTQFHPEYESRPLRPHPIFVAFVKALI